MSCMPTNCTGSVHPPWRFGNLATGQWRTKENFLPKLFKATHKTENHINIYIRFVLYPLPSSSSICHLSQSWLCVHRKCCQSSSALIVAGNKRVKFKFQCVSASICLDLWNFLPRFVWTILSTCHTLLQLQRATGRASIVAPSSVWFSDSTEEGDGCWVAVRIASRWSETAVMRKPVSTSISPPAG